MPITLAVGADNSRRRHHVFFIFARIAVRPKMCPALRCAIGPESLFARPLWHHPADAIVTSSPARSARPITQALGVPRGPRGVVSPGPAPSTVFVVDKPQGLHCKTKVCLSGTRRMMVRSRIGWLHTGQRRSLSRRFMVAATRRGCGHPCPRQRADGKAPTVLWPTANCPAW
jgi:hypothetical protein